MKITIKREQRNACMGLPSLSNLRGAKKLIMPLYAALGIMLVACSEEDDEMIIRFNQSDLVMIEGSREKFLLIADPPGSLSTETERNSPDNDVTTVDENGTILSRSTGKTVITASTSDMESGNW